MPIYEFACEECRTVFQFFFSSATDRRKPRCPRCGKGGLRRRLSSFSVARARPSGSPGAAAEEGGEDLSEAQMARMEKAMSKLEREMSDLDENDPRQMGRFMRRMVQETGLDLGPEMETAIRRLEAGEDPERIEEEMGDLLGDDGGGEESGWEYDDHLYEP